MTLDMILGKRFTGPQPPGVEQTGEKLARNVEGKSLGGDIHQRLLRTEERSFVSMAFAHRNRLLLADWRPIVPRPIVRFQSETVTYQVDVQGVQLPSQQMHRFLTIVLASRFLWIVQRHLVGLGFADG